MTEGRQRLGIVALLFIQTLILYMSINNFFEISIFCTATHEPALEYFGAIHWVYAGLLLLGLVSLAWRRIRLVYAASLLLSLLVLPAQAWLVDEDRLYCDAP